MQFLNGKQISAEQVQLTYNDNVTQLKYDIFSLTSFDLASVSSLVSLSTAEVNY